MRITIEPGGRRFVASRAPLKNLVMTAYGVAEQQLTGGPAWADSEGFDIEAKSELPVSAELMRGMLQALLAERFTLAVRREQKELTVDALITGKGSLKLRPADPGDRPPRIAIRGRDARGISMSGECVTLPFIADYLGGKLHRIVIDKTGLSGRFDFDVTVAIDREELGDPSVAERDYMVHLFTDFVETLGLRLQSRKAPVEVLTIEHANRPSGN